MILYIATYHKYDTSINTVDFSYIPFLFRYSDLTSSLLAFFVLNYCSTMAASATTII